MREITSIIIHCSATALHMDIGVEEIRQWHIDRNFSDVGYHHIIRRNGVVEHGRDHETVGAHVVGHNSNSIGVCLVGGLKHGRPDFNFTLKQFTALHLLIDELTEKYGVVEILGHRDIEHVKKACPCFDVREWFGYDQI